MKKTLAAILFILFISIAGMAQTVKPIGQPNDLNKYRGGLSADSFIHVPTRSANSEWHGRKSDFIHDGGQLLYYDEPTESYKVIGGEGAGFINWSDTTNTIATKTDLSADFVQTVTGLSGNTITLSKTPKQGERLIVIMNTALIYPVDYTLSGNVLTLDFTPSVDDQFLIYIKTKFP